MKELEIITPVTYTVCSEDYQSSVDEYDGENKKWVKCANCERL